MAHRQRSDRSISPTLTSCEQYVTLLTLADRTIVLVFTGYNTKRVNDLETTLQLDSLQVLGMSRLCCNCVRLAKKERCGHKENMPTRDGCGPWIVSES